MSKTLAELFKIEHGLNEDEVFELVESGVKGTVGKYKIFGGRMYNCFNDGSYELSGIQFNTMTDRKVRKLPWAPKVGDFYYVLSAFAEWGFYREKRRNPTDDTFKRLHDRKIPMYKTKDEAVKAAKLIGWCPDDYDNEEVGECQ